MVAPKETPLSQIVLRLLLACFSVILLSQILLNYQSSYQAIKRENQHHLEQASSLLHTVLNYRLQALSHSQDFSIAPPFLATNLSNQDTTFLDDYFLAIDENAGNSTPDFRFIAMDNRIIWNDSNSIFFGFDKTALVQLLKKDQPNFNWLLHSLSTPLGKTIILMRKTPIIADSGKITATLYIAVVLNDNTSFLQQFEEVCGSQIMMLLHQGKIIASSVAPDSPEYLTLKSYISPPYSTLPDNQLIQRTPIALKETATDITLVALHHLDNIAMLQSQFFQNALFGTALILLLSILAIHSFRKYTLEPLNKLVNYARDAPSKSELSPFPQGSIKEYNHIGKAFENTLGELNEKEHSLNDLFNSAFSPILLWDSNLNLKHINPAAINFLCINCLCIKNKTSPDLNCLNTFKHDAKAYLQQALAGQLVKEVVLNAKDNRAFLWNFTPIIVNGKTNAIIAQGLDITMIKQAEEDSHQARQAAEAANKAKSSFLATISHEIRTPLNGILGMAQIIQETLKKPEQKQQMKILYDSGNHLLTLLNDILDFSKIEQGKLELNKIDFLFNNMLRSISEIYRPLCEQKELSLTICNSLSDTSLQLHADDARIRQILFNLLSNAVKFTHSGGITLSIECLAENEKKINLLLAVSDTGIGIRKERLDTLFQPFVQAENSITRRYGGSGLGLSIVKNLIEHMKGTISVDSQFGSGTTISVLLPLEKSLADLQQDWNEALVDNAIKELDILLVEDDKINALVAKTFCEKQGYQVQWVQNGQLALEAVQNRNFDLIIMDNHMPVMDGIEATKQIRRLLQQHTVIFAYTADVLPHTRDKFMTAGANEVLLKPLKKEGFLQALHKYQQVLNQCHQQKTNRELDSTQ